MVVWLVRLFFCVDVIDGAQQCSVLQVVCGDIDGIHRHSCFAVFRVFSRLVFRGLLCRVIEVFTESGLQ